MYVYKVRTLKNTIQPIFVFLQQIYSHKKTTTQWLFQNRIHTNTHTKKTTTRIICSHNSKYGNIRQQGKCWKKEEPKCITETVRSELYHEDYISCHFNAYIYVYVLTQKETFFRSWQRFSWNKRTQRKPLVKACL